MKIDFLSLFSCHQSNLVEGIKVDVSIELILMLKKVSNEASFLRSFSVQEKVFVILFQHEKQIYGKRRRKVSHSWLLLLRFVLVGSIICWNKYLNHHNKYILCSTISFGVGRYVESVMLSRKAFRIIFAARPEAFRPFNVMKLERHCTHVEKYLSKLEIKARP